jgi:release factor glutamine methyltransferase
VRDGFAAAVERLKTAGIESTRADARVLEQAAQSPEQFDSFVARRATREPVAYITGHKEFWSLDFDVGNGVLIPRPDTEVLVEQALKEFPDRNAEIKAADLGAGSGAILISFLRERPGADGLAVENSPEAMIWVRKNIEKHGLHDRCVVQGDDWLVLKHAQFDVIFSNPPYIPSADIGELDSDVRLFEPHAALDGGRDGLDAYRALAPIIARSLSPPGRAFLEIGQGQDGQVPAILEAAGLKVLRVVPDLAGIPRCVVATLC